MTPFGPQLIGEAEKTIGAILRHVLADTDLTEREWVTLKIAAQNADEADLARLVADRAHFTDGTELVAGLRARGLLTGDAVSDLGFDLVGSLQGRISSAAAPVWDGLAADDVAAAERVLNEVVARARGVLETV